MKMKMKRNSALTLSLALCAGALLAVPNGKASIVIYHVDVNTAALVGNASGPFSLDFQLNDGSGAGDGNNTATLNHFAFGSGSASGSPTSFGGASGNLSGAVTLTDTTAFNEFFQGFTAGNTLSFDITLTLNSDAGPTPDSFSFGILDNSLYNLPTTGVGDSFLLVNLGSVPSVSTAASVGPAVAVNVTPVPEPGSLTWFSMGLMMFGLWRRARSRRQG
jgi:hypothetical protein